MALKYVVQAPGRINLIGEHTDYNGGFCLPAAIDKQIRVEIQKNEHPTLCTINAHNVKDTAQIDLNYTVHETDKGWLKYIIGVIEELRKRGADIQGFDADFSGNVPLGSGMSSSAALECSFALALNKVFDLGFDKMTLIKVAQKSEHNYVGSMCGIMDQYASIMGKKNHALLLDCQTETHQYYPIELGDYTILIINTNVKHALADSEYNTRRAECEAGVAAIQKKYPAVEKLRQVGLAQLEEFRTELSPTIFGRCQYVIEENERVLQAVDALQKNDIPRLGKLMFQSHEGLQHKYQVSCPELDYLVDQAKSNPNILGARMMGGGFGGCTINIIDKKKAAAFISEISAPYEASFNKAITHFEVSIENGAEVLEEIMM